MEQDAQDSDDQVLSGDEPKNPRVPGKKQQSLYKKIRKALGHLGSRFLLFQQLRLGAMLGTDIVLILLELK